MKSLYLRSGLSGVLALACALGLAACGAGSATLTLGGGVSGLSKSGLVIQNNGGPDLAVPANSSSFYFNELIGTDQQYNVTIKTQPTGAVCTVSNGTGRSAYNVTTVQISCVTNSYDVGGTISGLGTATGLILNNGSDLLSLAAGATTFNMTKVLTDTAGNKYYIGRVADGAPYGITVLQQPTGKTCSVSNGVGVMADTAITNIAVSCI